MKTKNWGLLVLAFLLTSCLTMENEISLSSNGSGSIKLSYSIMKMFMNLGKVDEDDPVEILPVAQADFENTVNQIPGLQLNSWARSEGDQRVQIDAELSFSNTKALVDFYDATGLSLMELGEDGRSLSLQLTTGGKTYDDNARQIIDNFFEKESVSFIFKAPSSVSQVSEGTSKGRQAEFSSSVKDLLLSEESVSWRVSW